MTPPTPGLDLQTPQQAAAAAVDGIWAAVVDGTRTTLVDSPPGAGKSTLTRTISARLADNQQVPVVVQTNEQADDMVAALAADNRGRVARGARPLRVGRLHRAGYQAPDWMVHNAHIDSSNDLAHLRDADVIVAPAAKWAHVSHSWPFAIIDESYQMRSVDLYWIGDMAGALLAVGDPGQVAPFTSVDPSQFDAMPLSPVSSAALTLRRTQPGARLFALPVSWRLTPAAVALVSPAFYRVPFEPGTAVGERTMTIGNQMLARPARQTVAMMCATGWAHLELPGQLMPDNDPELAAHLASTVLGLLDARLELNVAGQPPRLLEERGIAVGVTHNSQVNAVKHALRRLSVERGRTPSAVTVQTANKIQGREFDVTLVWHPLSGRRDASEFHLDAGRLCVLLSRHRFGCIVVSRDGVGQQLFDAPSSDDYHLDTEAQVDGWLAQTRALELLHPHVVTA